MKDEEAVGPLPAPTAPVAVFWDLENCHVPSSVEAAELVGHIFTALRQRGLSGVIHIQAYADTSILPVEVNSGLSSTGVHLLHVARGRKEASDKAILVDMVLWALDHPPPAHFLLISGDRDFSNVLHRLKFRQYNIMLATTLSAKPSLVNAASLVWDWAGLARGEQLDPVPKAKRQAVLSPPPSGERRPQYSQKETRDGEEGGYSQGEGGRQGGSATGWGHDEPRHSQQTEASRGEEMDGAARGGDAQGRGVSPAVREMLGGIVKGHPDGCSVGEVMQALRTHGFKINWVGMGFSNLLGLLKALPDVCLVDEDVRTKEGYKLTRIYPARQSAGSSRRSSGALTEGPDTNANYGQSQNNQTQPLHANQSSQGHYKQSPPAQYNQKPSGQYNQTPPVQYNQTPPVQYNQGAPVQYNQGPPLLHTPEPAFLGPRPNGAASPRQYDPRPPVPPPSTFGPARGPAPPPHSYQGPPRPSFSEARADARGPAPPHSPRVAPGEFRTLVAVVWELQRQAGGQPPDQRQVISMLRNEHGELFASLGGYGLYETPFKYIEAAQRAGYLDIRPGPAPGSVALALTSKAGEHAYDFPQNPPHQATQPAPPPRVPYSTPPSSHPPSAQPTRPTVQVSPPELPPRSALEPSVVVSADPPEAEPLSVPLPPVLLKGTAASLRRDLMAPTEANIRARVVQLMRPQSVMAGGTELKQWFVPDSVWEAAVKAAIAEGALVPSTLANREVLLPQGLPSWRFVDPHFTITHPAHQWAALEDCLRTAKGRAVIEGSYTRYAAARGMLQAGAPALKELALGQMINMLQAAVKKGWILPGPNWRPARVTLTPAAAPQQAVLASPSSGSSAAAPSSLKSPPVARAAPPPAAAAAAAGKKKEYPPWLAKLRQWLPLFLQQIGAKGCKLAALKGTFKQASGIDISEADVKEAGFLKFSQMLAAMPDVCTLHPVIYHGTNTDYVLYPPGWTPPSKGAPSEALSAPPPAAAVRSASPGVPVATFFPKEVDESAAEGGKVAPAVDRETVKRDMAQLLAELLPKYPDGLNAGGIKILFANRFGYQLDHEAVGYPKLRDLLQALPASCRLTFHPYIMIHARTTPAHDSSPQDGKPDRNVGSPVKKSAAARSAAAEGPSLGVKPALPAERTDKGEGASEGQDLALVGPIGSLSQLPGAELSVRSMLGASDAKTETASKAPGEGPPLDGVRTEAPVPGSVEKLATTATPVKQPSESTVVVHESESPSTAATDLMDAVSATTLTGGDAAPLESPTLSAGTSGQHSPEVTIPVAVAVGATPEPAKALNWSPDSLATPVAATPDHKLVLPHEAAAYSVKPAELRSRLAKEVHAIQEETEPPADGSAEESPVSVDSVAAAPSEDAHFPQRNGGSSGQDDSAAGHVAVSEVATLSDVTVVSDGSASADGGSDADSGPAAGSSVQ